MDLKNKCNLLFKPKQRLARVGHNNREGRCKFSATLSCQGSATAYTTVHQKRACATLQCSFLESILQYRSRIASQAECVIAAGVRGKPPLAASAPSQWKPQT